MSKKRIVVKIGSSSLTNDQGEIDQIKFQDHIEALSELRKRNHEVILVSSGAVAAGFKRLGYPARPLTTKGKQAAAAVGQGLLIESYIEKFSDFGIVPAQLLLTRNDFSNREQYRNAFATVEELLERGILPIINENDTVAVEELTFGDNDMLSALVSGFIHADQLIILTDVNGLYDSNPNQNPHAKRLDYIEEITEEMFDGARGTGSKVGTGGMKSKLLAAQTALSLGVPVFIGKGEGKEKLVNILAGQGDGTYIRGKSLDWVNTNRQWIGYHSEIKGKLYIDQGAEEAILYKGMSLLPAGVFKVQGVFQTGDVVEVYGQNGVIGKGAVSFSSKHLHEMLQDRLINQENNGPTREIIHRDRWVPLIQ